MPNSKFKPQFFLKKIKNTTSANNNLTRFYYKEET